jgi:hypothetical protein
VHAPVLMRWLWLYRADLPSELLSAESRQQLAKEAGEGKTARRDQAIRARLSGVGAGKRRGYDLGTGDLNSNEILSNREYRARRAAARAAWEMEEAGAARQHGVRRVGLTLC